MSWRSLSPGFGPASSWGASRLIPAWFTDALETPRGEGIVDADGCPIHYLDWGDTDAPGLVFIHGGAAHAHWWTFLAPLFTFRWRVVALDLSGHGDSGRREAYSAEAWAGEVAAVVRHAAFPSPPVIVGHSLGGLVAIQTTLDYCSELAGVVLVEAAIRRPDPTLAEGERGRRFRYPRTYPTREEAMEHFRLIPEQADVPDFILEHIARCSLRGNGDGWTWKFDPAAFARPRINMAERLAAARCRLALFYGERSALLSADTAAYMSELMGGRAPVIPIPEAHHHLVLDHPLAFVAALRTLLLDWEHSKPRAGG
jgi:pimeloyl-ACP methyl ester carboxylesterase